jgi:hypothetical protein
MKSRKVKYIPKQERMSNSPDLSPMDFGINSIFKNLLSEKKASTLDGMKRVMKQVWSKLPLGVQLRTMKIWEKLKERAITWKMFWNFRMSCEHRNKFRKKRSNLARAPCNELR